VLLFGVAQHDTAQQSERQVVQERMRRRLGT
jgi:hypothetical protein